MAGPALTPSRSPAPGRAAAPPSVPCWRSAGEGSPRRPALPRLLIQVGAAETLLDDSIALARAAGMADVMVDLQIWPEMIHIWHIFFPILGAGRRAIASGGTFVRNALGAGL